MRMATKRRSHVLPTLRMALLSAIAMGPFLTLLAPGSGGSASPWPVSAAAAAPAGRPTPTAMPHFVAITTRPLPPRPARARRRHGHTQRFGPTRVARSVARTQRPAPHRGARRRGRHYDRHVPVAARHSVGYDRYSLLVDGRRVVLFGGEYQFWRTPAPARWPVILGQLRAAGLNTVTVGVSWQYHSPTPGVYDFSGIRDLGRFLAAAAAAGLYVIARPGPAYNSESNASNLPGWLLAQGGNLRANRGHAFCGASAYSPVYAAAYTDWYRHALPIIAARQITTGRGTVIALQIENEYAPQCGETRYMRELHDLAREMGIDVPLLANNNTCCTAAGSWHGAGDDGQPIVDIPAEDDYPCAGICPTTWDSRVFHTVDGLEWRLRSAGVTAAPIAVAELQGGYYTGWGGGKLPPPGPGRGAPVPRGACGPRAWPGRAPRPALLVRRRATPGLP